MTAIVWPLGAHGQGLDPAQHGYNGQWSLEVTQEAGQQPGPQPRPTGLEVPRQDCPGLCSLMEPIPCCHVTGSISHPRPAQPPGAEALPWAPTATAPLHNGAWAVAVQGQGVLAGEGPRASMAGLVACFPQAAFPLGAGRLPHSLTKRSRQCRCYSPSVEGSGRSAQCDQAARGLPAGGRKDLSVHPCPSLAARPGQAPCNDFARSGWHQRCSPPALCLPGVTPARCCHSASTGLEPTP